jgi:hypothetical protein
MGDKGGNSERGASPIRGNSGIVRGIYSSTGPAGKGRLIGKYEAIEKISSEPVLFEGGRF